MLPKTMYIDHHHLRCLTQSLWYTVADALHVHPPQRARALAASGPVFSAFTPQSILRSSLRPTPVATPSASPGRSITPPLRSKESRITFIEEEEAPETEKGIRWTNGVRLGSIKLPLTMVWDGKFSWWFDFANSLCAFFPL